MNTPMRKAHRLLPSVELLLKNKKDTHNMWHPKGAYVLIGAMKVNQYKVRLYVDLWNINYDVHTIAADAFRSRYHAYLDWLALKKRKGVGSFSFGIGGTYNFVEVMNQEADDWMKQLWELSSEDTNILSLTLL